MCGICGFLAPPRSPSPGEPALREMMGTLAHRGPDEQGLHLVDGCGLGHTRLSIIDLPGGRQPLLSEDGTIALVGNGEIYNYRSLRDELVARGHRFRTRSDNEVIVHLWEDRGEACVEELRGMFAFVLHDRRSGILFGARDRFGQKPLFYRWDRQTFTFASEIKALLALPGAARDIDLRGLDQFLFYQFVPPPRTLFTGLSQLPPAHRFRLREGTLHIDRYWRWELQPDRSVSIAAHVERTADALVDAVRSHLVSDVPVGVFLSGGIDSSLVAAIAARHAPAPLRTFSIAFPDTRDDESEFSRLASEHLGTYHRSYAFKPDDLRTCIEDIARTFDQPLADRAVIPLMLLSGHTAHEVKVVLTGDGGDELFAGYEKYRRACRRLRVVRSFDPSSSRLFSPASLARCAADATGLRKLCSRVAYRHLPLQECLYLKGYWEGWRRHELYQPAVIDALAGSFEAITPPEGAPSEAVNRMLAIDAADYLAANLLLKTDFATMASGLEARAPLLDHRLAEVAGHLPIALKATRHETKVVLRRVARRYLPAPLTDRPKHGFSVPLGGWFRNELQTWLRERLLDSSTTVPRYLRPDTVARVLDEHVAARRDHTSRLYSLLVFELWHRHYMR